MDPDETVKWSAERDLSACRAALAGALEAIHRLLQAMRAAFRAGINSSAV